MLHRSFALGLLLGVAQALAAPPPAPPAPVTDVRAECMRGCAGQPGEATGSKLLECLRRCEAPAVPDAGVR